MINRYDQKYNRVHLLNKSKWTAIKKVNGWRHFMVKDVNKKNKTVEMFAVCDRKSMMTIDISELKPKKEMDKRMALTIDCFFCYEKIVIPNEEEFNYSEFIWDCDVCCNPNLIKYQLKNEEIIDLEVISGNE